MSGYIGANPLTDQVHLEETPLSPLHSTTATRLLSVVRRQWVDICLMPVTCDGVAKAASLVEIDYFSATFVEI